MYNVNSKYAKAVIEFSRTCCWNDRHALGLLRRSLAAASSEYIREAKSDTIFCASRPTDVVRIKHIVEDLVSKPLVNIIT